MRTLSLSWSGARQGLITSGLNHVAHGLANNITKRALFRKLFNYAANQLGEKRGSFFELREHFGSPEKNVLGNFLRGNTNKMQGYERGRKQNFRMNFRLNGEKIKVNVEYIVYIKYARSFILANNVRAMGAKQPNNFYYNSGRMHTGRGSIKGISGYGLKFEWLQMANGRGYQPATVNFHILGTPEVGLTQMNRIMEFFNATSQVKWDD